MTTQTLPSLSLAPAAVRRRTAGVPNLWVPALSLCHRELVRFLRQRHRVIGSLLTPILFWVGIGMGLQHSFRGPGQTGGSGGAGGGYMEYFFPGTTLMILLFTAIFSTISIIEDRREGFLQSVLVAPVSRAAVVLGKVLGGAVLAFGQGLLFLLLAPTVGIHPTLVGFVGAAVMMAVLSFSLTALGFCIAWRMTSTQGFHVIMNLFLVPMWFTSGALFPAAGAALPMRVVMAVNPLTYGLTGLRECLYRNDPAAAGTTPFWVCLPVSVALAAGLFALATSIARRRTAADLV